MTLTKNALGNLINRYEAVLEKCRLCNAFGSLKEAAARVARGGAKVVAAGVLGAMVMAWGVAYADTTIPDGDPGNPTISVTGTDNTRYIVKLNGQLWVNGGNASGNNEIQSGGVISMDRGQVHVTNLLTGGIMAMRDGTAEVFGFSEGGLIVVQGGSLSLPSGTMSGTELLVNGSSLNLSNRYVAVGLSDNDIKNLLGIDWPQGVSLPIPFTLAQQQAIHTFTTSHSSGYLGISSATTLNLNGHTLTVGDMASSGTISGEGGTITASGTVELKAGTSTIGNLTAKKLEVTGGTHTVSQITTSLGNPGDVSLAVSGSGSRLNINGGFTLGAGTTITVDAGTLDVKAGTNLSSTTLSGGGTISSSGNFTVSGDLGGANANGTVSSTGGSVTLDGSSSGLNSPNLNISAAQNIIIQHGDVTTKTLTAGKDITATGQNISAATISASGTVEAKDITATGGSVTANAIDASGDINADTVTGTASIKAANITTASLTTNDLTATGNVTVNSSVSLGTGNVTGTFTANNATGDVGTLNAGTFQMNGGAITADAINADINVNGGMVSTNAVDLSKAIAVTAGGLTIGSKDPAPLAEAMSSTGRSAGLSLTTPLDISGAAGTISVGNATAGSAGEVALGSNAVMNVNAKGVAESTPILKAKTLTITSGAALNISGAEGDQVVTVYEAGTVNGSFGNNVFTDNTLLSATWDDSSTATRGVYRISLNSASSIMPRLDPELANLMDNAMRNREIGTRDSFINSPQGGVRFLSRAISTKYGGVDREQASVSIESAARSAVVGAVPMMTLSASGAGSSAVANRMISSSTGDSVMTVSLNETGETGLSAGDDPAAKRTGFAMWITPLYQNWTGFGLEGGNYNMDVHGALGGIALGADYTFENAIRAGITFNIGGGYADGSGDFNNTTNSMSFWGVGLYGGWMPGDFSLTADVNFTSVSNSLKQELPAAMRMSDLESDLSSWAFSAGLRADYTFRTEWVDVTPHAGVRYTHLKVNGYDLESGGMTVLEGDAINQDIWSFPVGVTFAKNLETGSGWYVKPSLDLRVTPRAGDINTRADVRFTGVGGVASLETQIMDYVTYGGTAGLEFGKENVKMGLNYNLEAGAHSTQHGLYATFRYEF